ncbi:hypothetical protein BB559_002907 [Furculomyces boomerangus]|uniref:Prolyl 4-hydroxylase alpha subunit domain-containing protein n=2 Tax=Harpellales TaxID=61421 RepID=A0A2T9YRB4_9FUNG|nr:hypothetical protein BB559_002907 [Furculomyces boomerangus]PVZ97812.1 hypothetical protein BB558_006218 [Smittium angustum]
METDLDFDVFGDFTDEEYKILECHKQEIIQKQKISLGLQNCIDTDSKTLTKSLDQQRLAFKLSSNLNSNLKNGFPTLRQSEPVCLNNLFSRSECEDILDDAYLVTKNTGKELDGKDVDNVSNSDGWYSSRHSSFPTTDLPAKYLNEKPREMIKNKLNKKLLPFISERTGIDSEHLVLRDLFIVKYNNKNQKGLAIHTDGCLISFTMLLNKETEFTGGGTYFKKFDKVFSGEQGTAVVFDAKLEHSGFDIHTGTRLILVGFVDTTGGLNNTFKF